MTPFLLGRGCCLNWCPIGLQCLLPISASMIVHKWLSWPFPLPHLAPALHGAPIPGWLPRRQGHVDPPAPLTLVVPLSHDPSIGSTVIRTRRSDTNVSTVIRIFRSTVTSHN